MFIEQRTYTLRPGTLERFWQLQQERGFEVVRPIMERLVGYFGKAEEDYDQVVHLYRYDSHDDWIARLHGLYGKPQLDAYFKDVRALMLAQENTVLAPAPSRWLTPILGNGKDWLPEFGPLMPSSESKPLSLTIQTVDFLPGTLPSAWQTLEAETVDKQFDSDLLGAFVTVIGRQHRMIIYRMTSVGRADEYPPNTWLDAHGDVIVASVCKEFQIAPFPVLSPLFASAGDDPSLSRKSGPTAV